MNINSRGYLVSSAHPLTEFIHFPKLRDDEQLRTKIKLRCLKFINIFQQKNVDYLCCLKSEYIHSVNDVNKLTEDIVNFHNMLTEGSTLLLYFSFEGKNQDNILVDTLIHNLREFTKIKISKFVKDIELNGVWGDEDNFYKLIDSFGLKVTIGLPKINITKQRNSKFKI